MNVFVTGATGFVVGAVARRLIARGDGVRALVRDARRASGLEGAELVYGDLTSEDALRAGMRGVDAVIHGAAIYEIGVGPARRRAMLETNVRGTGRVLSTAMAAGVTRAVYVSTIAVFGNTRGAIVDETFVRTDPTYTSYYEETKVLAHHVALRYAADGLPLVIVQPGQVYGPGDHSGFGRLLSAVARGRLPAVPFPELGLNLAFRDDIADGIVRALDHGTLGRSYVLGGEIVRVGDAVATLADVLGRPAPRWSVPPALLELAALLRPRLREVITSARDVTFWASDARARAELGYAPRDLRTGLADTYAPTAGGRPPGPQRSSSSSSDSSSDSNSSE